MRRAESTLNSAKFCLDIGVHLILAAPIAILGIAGYGILAHRKHKKLMQIKEALLKRAIQLRDGVIQQLKAESDFNKERLDYLSSLNIMLQAGIRDLQADLAT